MLGSELSETLRIKGTLESEGGGGGEGREKEASEEGGMEREGSVEGDEESDGTNGVAETSGPRDAAGREELPFELKN